MTRPPWLHPLYDPQPVSLGGYVVLTNIAAAYDGTNAQRGLGCAYVDFTGLAKVTFRVAVNKAGTGTQSWQLWNETDGAQLAVLDDAGAAGNKALEAVLTSGLPTGIKLVRVRAKSTVTTDDPVYFGACLLLE